MKKCFIIFCCAMVLLPVCMQAQDILSRRDGTTIEAKVLEVTSSEIKYKKHTNLDGPTYTVPVAEVASIVYSNGERESFALQQPSEESHKHNAESADNNSNKNVVSASNSVSSVGNVVMASQGVMPPSSRYRDLRYFYNFRNYDRAIHHGNSPFWCGVASFFIPGLGQTINGEFCRGVGFFFLSCFLPVIGGIWNICDAVRVTKVKNMYRSDLARRGFVTSIDSPEYMLENPDQLGGDLSSLGHLSLDF